MSGTTFGRVRDLGGLPEHLRSAGGEEAVRRVFERQDLPASLLDTPDAAIPMRDIVALYRGAAEVAGVRSFGLHASAGLRVEDFGAMGAYILQGRDLTSALRRFGVALPFYESGSGLDIAVANGEIAVSYWNVGERFAGWRHAGDFTLCIIQDIVSAYLGEDWMPKRVETCYGNGQWIQDLEDHFHAPVLSDCDHVRVVLDSVTVRENRRPPVGTSDDLVSIDDMRRLGSSLPRDFPSIARNVIERRLASGLADLDGVASALGLGRRSFQRRLAQCGFGYRYLLTRCRMERAYSLLGEPDIPVGRIGAEVGYASTPQFTRAFKDYFGRPPAACRRSR